MTRCIVFAFFLTTMAVAPAAAQDNRAGGVGLPSICHVTDTPPPAQGAAPRPVDIPPVSDVAQCPQDPACQYCIVDISGGATGRDAREILRDAVLRCNTKVRLGPGVGLDFSDRLDLRPLRFGQCVTLTSVSNFSALPARTPRSLGPALNYGPADEPNDRGASKTFLQVVCDKGNDKPSDHIRIAGFRLFGPSFEQQSGIDVGIRIHRCLDVEISNMEIAGWGAAGINVQATEDDPRITNFSDVRIHDNFFHHNQHPSIGGRADGYGVVTSLKARAHIYRNVFDFNRHAIAATGTTHGYVAEENLVLKGGGYHGGSVNEWTHIFDVHGTGCSWSDDLCGQAGEEFLFDRNSFQYRNDNAIKIRGKPGKKVVISRNIFPHPGLEGSWRPDFIHLDAIHLNTGDNVEVRTDNIIKTDTFGDYAVCDFDGDGIDDLFLATGATWWFSSSGRFHWTFLNTSSTRKSELRFGYFDDDDRCDVLTESGGTGRWLISRGGTGPWTPLEQVWPQEERDPWRPLKDVRFGRFDPTDLSRSRRTTHALHRANNGEWWVKKLSDGRRDSWEYVGGSSFPLEQLQFGDFTGDGVTDVLAVESGHWAISESARQAWRPLNQSLRDPVAGLLIANMDRDDSKEDILRFQVRTRPIGAGVVNVERIWWRSRNGDEPWTVFKKYPPVRYHPGFPNRGLVYPGFGFVGRFGAVTGGTLTIDTERFGHFFSPGSDVVGNAERRSVYRY